MVCYNDARIRNCQSKGWLLAYQLRIKANKIPVMFAYTAHEQSPPATVRRGSRGSYTYYHIPSAASKLGDFRQSSLVSAPDNTGMFQSPTFILSYARSYPYSDRSLISMTSAESSIQSMICIVHQIRLCSPIFHHQLIACVPCRPGQYCSTLFGHGRDNEPY